MLFVSFVSLPSVSPFASQWKRCKMMAINYALYIFWYGYSYIHAHSSWDRLILRVPFELDGANDDSFGRSLRRLCRFMVGLLSHTHNHTHTHSLTNTHQVNKRARLILSFHYFFSFWLSSPLSSFFASLLAGELVWAQQ